MKGTNTLGFRSNSLNLCRIWPRKYGSEVQGLIMHAEARGKCVACKTVESAGTPP